jgi:ATP-dependent RNA helicase RhlE
LFSATFSREIRELAHSFLNDPAVVEVARRNAPSELVKQVVHLVDAGRKRELLAHLISAGAWRQVLVFTRTKHGANRLAQQLVRDGISADVIHGNKSQNHRTRTLADFKDGELRVLVATDIAARGLDIEELPHVVNYDLSHVPEDYVHRIGRTGRAGVEGEAVSLVCTEESSLLSAIERLLGRSIEQRVVGGFEPGRGGAGAATRSAIDARTRATTPSADRSTARGAHQPKRQRQTQARSRSNREARRIRPNARKQSDSAPGQRSASDKQRSSQRSGVGTPARKDGTRHQQLTAPGNKPVEARPGKRRGAFAALLAGARRLID